MKLTKAKWLMLISVLLLAILVGCSKTDEEAAAKKEPAEEKQETAAEENNKEPATKPAETVESDIPVAAIHNVEEMVKEKGKYVPNKMSDQQKEDLYKELKGAPDGMTGEAAYSLAVSLLAADVEEAATIINEVDPVIKINSATPEDEIDIPDTETVNVAILLDASGSMAGEVSGGQKMKLAKSAIQKYASDLPEGSNIMLRVYGHEGTGTDADKAMSCASNEVVYNLGTYDEKKFTESLEQFDPAGWTPLAGAIEAAEADLKEQKGENVRNVVYVVSDGIETCDGDPVAAAASLNESDIQAEVNIIGFDVDNEGQKQLEEVAKAGEGQYKSVYSESELNEYLEQEYSRLYWEWLAWGNDRKLEILSQSNDIYGELLAANNDVSFLSLASKNEMYAIHYDLKELEKFKDEEAVDRYLELIDTRYETVRQHFRQESERKDETRKEVYEKLREQVDQLEEEKMDEYKS
ncbi:VWA domain-containing protein [Planomicrobium sp. Y74]|uniref:vWA domain-containing protein n=1 Tax=Planomicrobium sp. Y74 TaxID=2478977 RepID=UPI000EF50AF4|nr:VWA domain-containing protein [Planomicrobium sp. Y74]RLQ91498.1 VWA domain-containing protein [Planomicrobium sp. Y74]